MINPNFFKYQTNTSSNKCLIWFRDWIQENTGIYFAENKFDILNQRLISICVKEGIKDLYALKDLVLAGEKINMLHNMIDVATTNHTHFYRETSSIEYFINTIYPKYSALNDIRLWSAASSSGEELYTILLFLIERYGFEEIKKKFQFLGTDLSIKVIEQAEKAVYPQGRIDLVPPEQIHKWFEKAGMNLWRIKQPLIDLCIFRRFNLLCEHWPFSKKFHVIYLRNVLYYFDVETQEKVVNKFYEYTEDGGYLITSVTESFSQIKTPWKRVESGVYSK